MTEVPTEQDDKLLMLDLLRFKTYKGFQEKGYPLTKQYRDRIEYELGVIEKCGFQGYFLIVADLCAFMRRKGIRFVARGSGCGSAVIWGLGVSHKWLDPIKWCIPFERFLNPHRISNPDIDMDIQDDRREEVFQYTVQKYGVDKVAKIITFGTIGAKSGIMDIARALQIPDYQKVAAEISAAIPAGKGEDGKNIRLADMLKKSEYLQEKAKQYPDLFKFAIQCDGKIRSAGVHAAGTIIAPDKLTKYLPLYYDNKKKGESDFFAATQWDMYDAEDRGLLKMDYLGLKTLRVIDQTVKMINAIRQMRGEQGTFDVEDIPWDDEKAWKLLADGKTAGIFQIERTFVQNFARRMNLAKVKDPWQLAVLVAIIRPGMMDSGNTEVYLRRASGEEPVVAPHALLADTFNKTYGLMCFQEDVMSTCVDFAGFTMSEADVIRKGVGKKNKEFITKQQPKFLEGGMQPRVHVTITTAAGTREFTTKPRNPDLIAALGAAGYTIAADGTLGGNALPGCSATSSVVMAGATRDECEYVWGLIEAHSRYSFNNAHAGAYGLTITYPTAWFKANWTLPYMCSLINSESGATDKEQGYNYKVAEYVEEARYMGVKMLPPCVKFSRSLCHIRVVENEMRFGLSLIKKVSSRAVDWIVRNRRPHDTLKDFMLGCYEQELVKHTAEDGKDLSAWASYVRVGKGDLEALTISGAMDCFGYDRPTLLALLPKLQELAEKYWKQECGVRNGKNVRLTPAQVSQTMTDLLTQVEDGLLGDIAVDNVSLEDQLEAEREYTGCFLSQSPFEPYASIVSDPRYVTCTAAEAKEGEVDGLMQFVGLLSSARTTVIKNGKNKGAEMAFLSFKGVNADVECTAFNSTWEKLKRLDSEKDGTYVERGKVYIVHVKPDRNGRGLNCEGLARLSNRGFSSQ